MDNILEVVQPVDVPCKITIAIEPRLHSEQFFPFSMGQSDQFIQTIMMR